MHLTRAARPVADERKAAEQYLAKFDASPRTGEKLRHKEILPNLMARELCSCAMKLEM